MVDRFDDCEFWLPSDFLTDEDFDLNLKQSGTKKQESKKNVSDCVFGFSGTNSEMTSPGESAVSSAESESDEDEFITCLTHKMDHSNLQEKAWKLSSSPKSPLCNASGEFAQRQMVNNSAGLLPSRNEVFVPIEQPSLNLDFPTNHPPQLSYQQMQEVRFEQLRRHQMMIQNSQNIGIKNDERKPMCLPVQAWPPLYRSQQKPQPDLTKHRAVFLGNNLGGAKKQCVGTGVFLPRVPSSSGNGKNKPSCSPVLIPDRVVHALNLNLEALGVHNQAHHHPGYYNNNGFCSDNALKYKNEMKKNHVRTQPTQSIAREEPENPEVVRLPPEWTY